MLVFYVRVERGKKEPGEAEISKGTVAVKTEKLPNANQQALYLIVSLLDLECSRGLRLGKMRTAMHKGGELVLTDEANAISEDPARIPGFVWDMKEIKEKSKQSKGIGNLWSALSAGKHTVISFKSEENAQKAHEILRAAGFEEDMLKFVSKRSIKILGLPENLNIEGLTKRLAKNLERVKKETAAVEEKETELARAARTKEAEAAIAKIEGAGNIDEALAATKANKAAEMIRYVHDTASPSESMLYSVWFLLNKRPDVVQIVNYLRDVEPYDRWLRPFNALSKEDYLALIKSMREEKPLGEAPIKPAGSELAELRAYEAKRRGGPSEIARAAALQWRLPADAQKRIEAGQEARIMCVSADAYAQKRAAIESIYPGRAISLERSQVDEREWVLIVHRLNEEAKDAVEVAAKIRSMIGRAADAPVAWAYGAKKGSHSLAAAAYDAVNNYSTYATTVTFDPLDSSTIPAWFMHIVKGNKPGALKPDENARKILLEKGVILSVELVGTSYRKEGREQVPSAYTYRVTISGERVRRPLEVARREAKEKAAEIPPLKNIAGMEEPTYAERMADLKKKVKPGS